MHKMSKSHLCIAASILALAVGYGLPAHASEREPTLQALQEQINALQKQLAKLQAEQAKAPKVAVATSAAPAKAVTVDEKGALVLPNGTAIKLGGYIKLDALHDFSARPTQATTSDSTASDYTNFAAIPTRNDVVPGRRKHSTRFDARQTRVVLSTSTPTSYGPLETVIETDFYGTGGTALATNSYGLRLRKAYATYYGFLVGQNWTSFADLAVVPETLDVTGPAGLPALRQAQIRYTRDIGDGHSVFGAVENPETDVGTANGATAASTLNRYPDMMAGWKYQAGWGHLAARALVRNQAVKSSPGAAAGYDANEWGYGVAVSGKWNPFKSATATYAKDNILFLVQGGTGIGRYIGESANLAGVTDTNYEIKLLTSWGGNVTYQHFWTDALRSSFVYGHSQVQQRGFLGANTQKSADSIHANLIWSPIPSMDLGFEYIWGGREVHNDAKGFMNRLQASATYRF